jgi:hypothetical protein
VLLAWRQAVRFHGFHHVAVPSQTCLQYGSIIFRDIGNGWYPGRSLYWRNLGASSLRIFRRLHPTRLSDWLRMRGLDSFLGAIIQRLWIILCFVVWNMHCPCHIFQRPSENQRPRGSADVRFILSTVCSQSLWLWSCLECPAICFAYKWHVMQRVLNQAEAHYTVLIVLIFLGTAHTDLDNYRINLDTPSIESNSFLVVVKSSLVFSWRRCLQWHWQATLWRGHVSIICDREHIHSCRIGA